MTSANTSANSAPAGVSSADSTPRAREVRRVTVDVLLGGVRLPVEFDDEALAAITASRSAELPESWPEWMGVETAARYLDVTVERVRKLKERGRLPCYQEGPGCRVFFRRSELDEWMETLSHGSRTHPGAA